MPTGVLRNLAGRMRDAALLESSLYREVANSTGGNREATVVVLVAGLGFGVASFLGWALAGAPITGLVAGIVLEPIATLVAWLGGSLTAWMVGTRLAAASGETGRFWPVARALAFAQTPGLAGVLVVLPPPYSGGVWLVVRFWMLLASSTAIRETLGLSGKRTLVTLIVSAVVYAALLVGLFRVLSFVGIDGAMSLPGRVAA